MLVSLVIRTLDEARYLDELLHGVKQQQSSFDVECVVIDSGSTDATLEIAREHNCTITHITREEFSFGRSLNLGCEVAKGDILVFVSGHCVPANPHWLQSLCGPIVQGTAQYTYGRQLGGAESYFSEHRIFQKYFPEHSKLPQEGFFCNNANAAIARSAWEQHRFDEEVTGLEDMELAQRLCNDGGRIGYAADACVYHYHSESWRQVRRRFEREALALQKIMPQIHIGRRDRLRYTVTSIWRDWCRAYQQGLLGKKAWEIVLYRYHQYAGSYIGNHEHRRLSHAEKEKYFYPH